MSKTSSIWKSRKI